MKGFEFMTSSRYQRRGRRGHHPVTFVVRSWLLRSASAGGRRGNLAVVREMTEKGSG